MIRKPNKGRVSARLKRLIALGIALIFCQAMAFAVTYTFTGTGNYSNAARWSPSYPGTTIGTNETVIINGNATLNVDIKVTGTGSLTINSGATLSGTKKISEVQSNASVTNNGTLSVDKIEKIKGTVTLNGTTTVADEIKIEDSGSLTVGSSGTLTADKLEVKDNGSVTISGTADFDDDVKLEDDATLTVNAGGYLEAKKLELKDDVVVSSSGDMTLTENLEMKDDTQFTNTLGANLTVQNDLEMEDDASFSNAGTVFVEDDLKLKDDASMSSNGVLNVCDPQGTEAENKVEVENNAILTGTGTICMCSSNPNNNYDNTSSQPAGAGLTINTNCNGPLPVELTDFVVSRKNNTNIISWKTQSEIDNAFFEIQFSEDGYQFQTLAQLEGYGTTNELHKYQYEHYLPNQQGNVYYRLKNIDFNGAFDFSEMKVIHAVPDETEGYYVYPTYVKPGSVLFLSGDLKSITNIKLFDLNGNIIEVPYNGESEIIIPSKLSTGWYAINLYQSSSMHSTKIFIEQ